MKRIAIILCVIIMSLTLASCLKDASSSIDSGAIDTDNKVVHTGHETEKITESNVETEAEFYKADGEFIDLVTSYVTFKYPVSWDGIVKTEVLENAMGSTVKFYAYLDYMNIPLYDFVIGESDSGLLLGTLETSIGSKSVYLLDHTTEVDYSMSENSSLMYRQMGAQVNVIISNLIYESGMIE